MIYLLTIGLLLLAALARLLQGSWSSPGAMYGAVWAVACVPAILVFPDYVSPLSVFVVLSFVLAAVAGAQTASSTSAAVNPSQPAELPPFTGLAAIVLVLSVCGFAAAGFYVYYAGFALGDLLQAETWLKLAVQNSIARYRGDTEPFFIRLLLSLDYAGALLAGALFHRRSSPGAVAIATLPIVAAFLMTAFTTAKTPMLIALIFAFSGWLTLRVRAGSRVLSVAKRLRRSVLLAICAAVVAGFFVGSLMLRYGGDGASGDVVIQRLVGYGFAQMTALSAWLSVDDWESAPRTWGAYTFAGAFELLGIAQREKGLYEPIGLNEWSVESNVYSALRGLITDYGLWMAWLLLFAVSFAAQRCWLRLSAGQGGPLAVVGLTAFYSFAAWSPVVSVFAYNVVLLAFTVCALILPVLWHAGALIDSNKLNVRSGN